MRSRIVALSVGVLALSGACATSTGRPVAGTRIDASPAPERSLTPRLARIQMDSVAAQGIADREGPRVSLHAQISSLASNSRRVRASFTVDDDAYVLVGQVDADGIVRVVFPNTPHDDGFVRGGGHTYQTAEMFAGFVNNYGFRSNSYSLYNTAGQMVRNSGGYLFIVAAWRPLDYSRLSDGEGWQSFQTVTERDAHDPRPAIYELAALLAGSNREAYTVDFARYSDTMDMTSSYLAAGSPYGVCSSSAFSGIRSFGFPYSPVNSLGFAEAYDGEVFTARGRNYVYDGFANCFVPLGYGYGYQSFFGYGGYGYPFGYGGYPVIAQVPPSVPGGTPVNPRARTLSAQDAHRRPVPPLDAPHPKFIPDNGESGGEAPAGLEGHVSAQYRNRGLMTIDDPSPRSPGRAPRVGFDDDQSRPNIQQMVERRSREQNGRDDGWSRATMRNGINERDGRTSGRPINGDNGNGPRNDRPVRGMTPSDANRGSPRSSGTPRASAPASAPSRPSPPPPRSEPPRTSSGSKPPV